MKDTLNKIINTSKEFAIIFVLIILIAVFSLISPTFFSVSNFMNILSQNTYIIIASMGMALVIISGGIDLSVGYQISLVGIVTAALMKWVGLPIWLSIFLALVLGGVLGFINGFFSIKLKVATMVVTLGTMTIFQGISYIISKSTSIYDLDPVFKFIGQGYVLGIPFNFILTVFLAVIATIMLNNTYFGRYICAIGGNEEASRLAGINVKKIKVMVLIICGIFTAIASIVLVSRSGSTNSSVGVGTEFTCITAAVLGGVGFRGGEGQIWGVCVGALILGVLTNGMQIIGLGIYPQYIAKGVILLAAISFDTHQKQSA